MMREELKRVIIESKYNCVLLENNTVIMTSLEKGVSPLYNYINAKNVIPIGRVELADKIVGRAVAFLAIYLNVKYIYARTISKTALDILKNYEMEVEYDEVVPYILNRNKDGQCPMETALGNIRDAKEAYNIIDSFKKR